MRKVLGVALFAALLAAPAVAQPPSGQWWLLHQEVVKPSMVRQYEELTKEFIAQVQKNRATMPHFSFDCLMGEDFTYTYASPIANMAGYDQLNAEFGALMQAAGPTMMDLFARSGPTFEYAKEWVVGEEPELSYMPAEPRVKLGDARYFEFDFYYVLAGKEGEADALAKEVAAYFKSKGIADGYRIFKPVLGAEMPLIIVEQWGKDLADFQTADARNLPILGDGFKALIDRALALTRRFETQRAWARPDLSLSPMEMTE